MSNTALSHFVNAVQKLSGEGNFSQLAEKIKNGINDILPKHVSTLDNVMQTLTIEEHSLGILAILMVKIDNVNRSGAVEFDATFAQIQDFFQNYNVDHVGHLPELYCELCHKLTDLLISRNEAIRGIAPLISAMKRFRTGVDRSTSKREYSERMLTSVHADLCQLCLHAKVLKPALEFLDNDINDILKEHTTGPAVDSKHFLCYYYYGGMIYGALKNFSRALFFFETALTTPATAVSHIMIEAYKKHLLISLIVHGKIIHLPKYTSNLVYRFIKPHCQAYHSLADAYKTNGCDKLQEVIVKHTDLFIQDTNLGLVKQVYESLFKRNIQRLTKTFLTLSLADVANRCHLSGPEVAEKYILDMIENDEIYATINQRDGMVYFKDISEVFENAETLSKLDSELQRCMDYKQQLRAMDQELQTSPEYIKKMNKATKASSAIPAHHFAEDEGLGSGGRDSMTFSDVP